MIVAGDYRTHTGLVDVIITDPPYSVRTHRGHDASGRAELGYMAWSDADAWSFAEWCSKRACYWVVIITDHVLARVYEEALAAQGLYVFAPIPHLCPGRSVRLAGDGPSSWTDWIVCARTKVAHDWGTLPGGYITRPERGMLRVGGKPLALMHSLVSDYSREGDTILDPCAGGGTTGVACRMLNRRFVGYEIDAGVAAKANARLEATRLGIQGVMV